MSAAEELRTAAERLDALTSEAERISPRMWSEVMTSLGMPPHGYRNARQRPYIEAMHPGVGKTLAAWLRRMADLVTLNAPIDLDLYDHALAVARAINGSAS